MKPLKCAFTITSGKFPIFVVRHRGIKVDLAKMKAIVELPPPKNIRELRGFQGRIVYTRRFISNLFGKCEPFSKLMKKDAPFEWDEDCQHAFESIKTYLTKPPVLSSPIEGKPLVLYIMALESSLVTLLAQENEVGKENAFYYLSRTLVGPETRYSPIEKLCLAPFKNYAITSNIIISD